MIKDKVMDFIIENKEFFNNINSNIDFTIDEVNKYAIFNGRIITDGMILFQTVFRNKFQEMPPTMEAEFSRIRKMLYSSGLTAPISKKEYDEFSQKEISIINVEGALEAVANMQEDLYFTVPDKEEVYDNYKNAVYDIENIFPQMFIYKGIKARACKNINNDICSIDIFDSSGIIHLKAKGFFLSPFNEHSLSKLKIDTIIKVEELNEYSEIKEDVIYVTENTYKSIKNISNVFKKLDISIDNIPLLHDIIKELIKYDLVITINGEDISSYISSSIFNIVENDNDKNIYFNVLPVARIISLLNLTDKKIILSQLKGKIDDELFNLIEYGSENNNSDLSNKIEDLFNKKGIVVCAKNIIQQPSVVIYIKSCNKVRKINIDKYGIGIQLIPELGGLFYISKALYDDTADDGKLEVRVVSELQKFIQQKYSNLLEYKGTIKNGIYYRGDKVVYAINGIPSERTKDGYIFLNSEMDIRIKKSRSSVKTLTTSIDESANRLSDSIENIHTAIWLILSQPLVQIVSPIFQPNINFIIDEEENIDLLRLGLFKNEIRYCTLFNTRDDGKIKRRMSDILSPLVVDDLGLGMLRYASKQFLSFETLKDGEVIFKNASLYNLTTKENKYFLNIKSSINTGILSSLYKKESGISNSNFMSYFTTVPEKTRSATVECRNIFQSIIKGSILEGSSSIYYYFEMLLPSIVSYYMLYGKGKIKSFIRQLFINHVKAELITKNEIRKWIKKRTKKYRIKDREVYIGTFKVNDIENNFIGNINIDKILEKDFNILSKSTLKNYIAINGSPKLVHDCDILNILL